MDEEDKSQYSPSSPKDTDETKESLSTTDTSTQDDNENKDESLTESIKQVEGSSNKENPPNTIKEDASITENVDGEACIGETIITDASQSTTMEENIVSTDGVSDTTASAPTIQELVDKKESESQSPTSATEMKETPLEETSPNDETIEEIHTPIEEAEESIKSSISQQEEEATITETAVETAEAQESPPLEEVITVAIEDKPHLHEESATTHTTLEAETSSLSQKEEDTTITTSAENKESPPQEQPLSEASIEVAVEEASSNSQHKPADNTTSSQIEDDGGKVSSVEAGGQTQTEHFYVNENTGNNRRLSAHKKIRRHRRYLKIAIGLVLVTIVALGIGLGIILGIKDSEELTTAAMTTTTSATAIETTAEETTSAMTTIHTTTTMKTTDEGTTTTIDPSFISKAEMRNFTMGLMAMEIDGNNKGNKVKVDLQSKTEEGIDQDYGPLITLKDGALTGPTVDPFVALLDNYVAAVDIEETTTDEEEEEQKEFLDAVMETNIMKETEEFMKSKTFDGNLRDYLQQIWFSPYSRHWSGVNGTSGFEHTFVGEQKDGHVQGLQNWVNFQKQEENGSLKYKGWNKSILLRPGLQQIPSLKKQGQILELNFEWEGNTRSLDFMFIGTSPELEMALYTLCYWAKHGEKCHVQLNNHRLVIHTQDYMDLGVIGSAYPDVKNTIV